jgi:hypothetical protein
VAGTLKLTALWQNHQGRIFDHILVILVTDVLVKPAGEMVMMVSSPRLVFSLPFFM